MEDLVAPLNRVGDLQGSVRNDDGTVTTPEGFVAAYQAYVDAGWGGVPFPPEYGGGGFPWLVGIALQEILTSANMAFSMCPLLNQGAHRHAPAPRVRGAQGDLPPEDGHRRVDRHDEPHRAAGRAPTSARSPRRPCRRTTAPTASPARRSSSRTASTTCPTNIIHLVLARTPDGAAGHEGHQLLHRPEAPRERRRLARRAQRRHLRVHRAQDGHQGQPHVRAELRRAGRGRGRLPHRRGERRHAVHVHDDEQRPPVGGPRGPVARRAGVPDGRRATRRSASRAGPRARRPGSRARSSTTPTCAACCSRCGRRSARCAGSSTPTRPPSTGRTRHPDEAVRAGRAGARRPAHPGVEGLGHRPRRRAHEPRPSRCSAAWATSRRPASPSTSATPASPRSTRAPTASRRWTSSAASSRCGPAARSPTTSATSTPRSAELGRGGRRAGVDPRRAGRRPGGAAHGHRLAPRQRPRPTRSTRWPAPRRTCGCSASSPAAG